MTNKDLCEEEEAEYTLLTETIAAIKASGHRIKDVAFVGSADGKRGCSWTVFSALANKQYDSGYGSANVATDLVVVFSDGRHLYRGEYDGSEWWEYTPQIVVPKKYQRINCLIGRYWPTVEDLHDPSDTHHKI